ncbi:hypothetical protein ACQ4PT_007783 [Festuca glaucescens]
MAAKSMATSSNSRRFLYTPPLPHGHSTPSGVDVVSPIDLPSSMGHCFILAAKEVVLLGKMPSLRVAIQDELTKDEQVQLRFQELDALKEERLHALRNLELYHQNMESSSAQYILQQYMAASGGYRTLRSVRNAYAMGKVRMVASEFETATRVVKNRGPSGRGVAAVEQGGSCSGPWRPACGTSSSSSAAARSTPAATGVSSGATPPGSAPTPPKAPFAPSFGEAAMSHTKTRMEEAWSIEEVAFNVPGLLVDCFIPPADIRSGSVGEACELPPPHGDRAKTGAVHPARVAAVEQRTHGHHHHGAGMNVSGAGGRGGGSEKIVWRVEV